MHSDRCNSLDSQGDEYFDREYLMQLYARKLAKKKRMPPSKGSAQIQIDEYLMSGNTEARTTRKMPQNLPSQRKGREKSKTVLSSTYSINENIKVDKLQHDGKLLTESDVLPDVVTTSLITPTPPVTTTAFTIATTSASQKTLIPVQAYKFLNDTQLFKNSDTAPQSNLSNGKKSPFSSTVDSKDERETFEQTQHRIIFKYCYKEDQWSPLNPEGKKQYDRDFLLQVKFNLKLSRKLDDIPNLNIAKFEAYKAYLQNPCSRKKKKPTSRVVNSGNQASCGELSLPACPKDAPIPEELAAASLMSPTKETTAAASSCMSHFERNTSSVSQIEHEISNAVPLPGGEDTKSLCKSNNKRTPFSTNEGFSENAEDPFTPEQHLSVLKCCHTEDQWNPPNSEGKKQYGRQFLLQLQHHPMSLCKPYDLPNLDVVKKEVPERKMTKSTTGLPSVMNNQFQTEKPFKSGYTKTESVSEMPFRDASSNAPTKGRKGKKSRIAASFSNSFNENIKMKEPQDVQKSKSESETPPVNIWIPNTKYHLRRTFTDGELSENTST